MPIYLPESMPAPPESLTPRQIVGAAVEGRVPMPRQGLLIAADDRDRRVPAEHLSRSHR